MIDYSENYIDEIIVVDNLIIGIIRSNYINLHETLCSYAAKSLKNSIN
jgi:hypothetical protein